ncbi:hypothetical protein TNIN_140131 [Trichonephila inaurata madagascariensis]|uniref:Uncharacterized protein n=1 Tax=Trichonephila inaurata madagascariensis TaxID=2747483 RepID=A0A8X7C290_9ARAC|nr:hypothetical protein TNIN_140131 [Trichonephila inaurata madagascariensis]
MTKISTKYYLGGLDPNSRADIAGEQALITYVSEIKTKEAGSRPSVSAVQAQGGPIRSRRDHLGDQALTTSVDTPNNKVVTTRVKSKERKIQSSILDRVGHPKTAVQTTRSPEAGSESEEWKIQSSHSRTQ